MKNDSFQAHSINGIDPMTILQCVPAPPNLGLFLCIENLNTFIFDNVISLAVDMVTPYARKLLELLKTCNKDRFKALVNHQYTNREKV